MPVRQPFARRLVVAATSSALLLTAGTSVLAATPSASAAPGAPLPPEQQRMAAPAFGSPSSWTGTWIGRDNAATWPRNGEQNPAPLLRKSFSLTKPVSRAQLSI